MSIALVAAGFTQSCGTGIDSTPRITLSDVRRQVGDSTPEQRFLADITPEPLKSWTPGKRFFVTDDRFKLLLGNTAPDTPLGGRYITFREWHEHPTPIGKPATAFSFTGPDGEDLTYTSALTPDELANRDRVEIPFAIEASVVDEAARRLTGNTYYVLTADRFSTGGEPQRMRKFVPVTVKNVLPGNTIYPLSVIISEADGTESLLYMNVGTQQGINRSFDLLFSFSDPHKRYPAVTDQVWNHIIGNTVDYDMTRDECRLALGAPVNIDRRNNGGYILEIWTYENGVYLRFEDGVLKDYRK